jgi:hypothetical protein
VGFTAASGGGGCEGDTERDCDADAAPDTASVEVGVSMMDVVIGATGLKLTSNVADETPSL